MVALVKRVERFLFTEVPRRGFPRRSCGAERRVRQALLTRRSRRKRASLLPWRSSENPQLPPGLRPRRSPPAAAPDPQSTALRSGNRAARCHREWRRSWPPRTVVGWGSSLPKARGFSHSTRRKHLGLQDARRELLPSPSGKPPLSSEPIPLWERWAQRTHHTPPVGVGVSPK